MAKEKPRKKQLSKLQTVRGSLPLPKPIKLPTLDVLCALLENSFKK